MQRTWECLGLCVRVCVPGCVCLESEWYLEVLENSCQQLQFLVCNYAGRVNNCNALLSCLKLRRRYFCIFHAEFCLCAPNWHETHDVWIARSVCVYMCVHMCVHMCVFVSIFGTASDTCFGFKNSFCVSIPSLHNDDIFPFYNFPHFPKIFYELFPYLNEQQKGNGKFPFDNFWLPVVCRVSHRTTSNCIYKYVSYRWW